MRYYAPWLCRFVSVDPLAAKYNYYTPYQYAGNRPINFIDLDGAEPATPSGTSAGGLSPNNTAQADNTRVAPYPPLIKVHAIPVEQTFINQGPILPYEIEQHKMTQVRVKVAQNLANVPEHQKAGMKGIITGLEMINEYKGAEAIAGLILKVPTILSAVSTLGRIETLTAAELAPVARSGTSQGYVSWGGEYLNDVNMPSTGLRVEAGKFGQIDVFNGSKSIGQAERLGNGNLFMAIFPTITYATRGEVALAPGSEVFNALVNKVGVKNIQAIEVSWSEQVGWQGGSNLKTFNSLVARGYSREAAAEGTFTGNMAAKYGFTKATDVVIRPDGTVGAIFIRPR